MAVEPELRAEMVDNVGIELPTGAPDVQGHIPYGPKVNYPAYVEENPHFVRDQNTGNQVMSSGKVFLDTLSRDGLTSLVYPSLRTRVTMPSGRVTLILSLATFRTATAGIHHYELYVV